MATQQSTEEFNPEVSKAALILQAIARATDVADGDAGNVQATGDWLCLIEAAVSHAHFLLTGVHIDNSALENTGG